MAQTLETENAVEIFAQAIIDGHTNMAAYRLGHPKCMTTNKAALAVRACAFGKRQDVRDRINELREEAAARHAGFRERLADMLIEEISECYRDNKTLSPVMKQVDCATRILGMDKQVVDVNAKVGAADSSTVTEKINFLAEAARKGKINGKS